MLTVAAELVLIFFRQTIFWGLIIRRTSAVDNSNLTCHVSQMWSGDSRLASSFYASTQIDKEKFDVPWILLGHRVSSEQEQALGWALSNLTSVPRKRKQTRKLAFSYCKTLFHPIRRPKNHRSESRCFVFERYSTSFLVCNGHILSVICDVFTPLSFEHFKDRWTDRYWPLPHGCFQLQLTWMALSWVEAWGTSLW